MDIMITTKRRSEVRIYHDMLACLYEGDPQKIVSEIARMSNQSHDATTRKLHIMQGAGLIRSEVRDDSKVYALTENGIRFLKVFEEYQTFISSLGISLRV